MTPSSPIRPWHEDRENVADLLEWLMSHKPLIWQMEHGDPDNKIRWSHADWRVVDIVRNPGEWSREWLAFCDSRVRQGVKEAS